MDSSVKKLNFQFKERAYPFCNHVRFSMDEAVVSSLLHKYGVSHERKRPVFLYNNDGIAVQAVMTPFVVRDRRFHRFIICIKGDQDVFVDDGIKFDDDLLVRAWRGNHFKGEVLEPGFSVDKFVDMLKRHVRPRFRETLIF